MYAGLNIELNDYLIRKHLAKYNLDGGYYDVLMDYNEMIDDWDNYYACVLEAQEWIKRTTLEPSAVEVAVCHDQ